MRLEVEDLLRLAEWLRWRAERAQAEAKRLEAEERREAILAALSHFEGATWTRCSALAFELGRYATTAWPRERDMPIPPESAPPKRRALHRLLRSRGGEALGARQIYNIASIEIDARCDFNGR